MIETRTYYYARVSTSNQNLDRQMKAFRDLGADERNIVPAASLHDCRK